MSIFDDIEEDEFELDIDEVSLPKPRNEVIPEERPRKKQKKEIEPGEDWMKNFFREIEKERKRTRIERLERLFANRAPAAILDFGPDEISRYILDFINPIHSPPTAFDRWRNNTKKKWCPECGELCLPSAGRCNLCKKFLSWRCTHCDFISPAVACVPRRYPPQPDDSEYSSSEEY